MTNSAVLVSIHPKFAKKIISGEKRLEFRRSWASLPVDIIVFYATSSVQRIVAVANIKQVYLDSPSGLWKLSKSMGGCISRRELLAYLEGKKRAYAIELGKVKLLNGGLDPISLFGKNFRPPQSFQYLTYEQYESIKELFE